jgi:hypothetical protein
MKHFSQFGLIFCLYEFQIYSSSLVVDHGDHDIVALMCNLMNR